MLGAGIASLAIAAAAAADAPRAPTIADFVGARALSMSAYVGVAPGNDGIFTNPAGLAARRRYAIEGQYFLDRAGADSDAQFIDLSVVDSQSGLVTGGFAYTRLPSGNWIGNAFHAAFALPVSEGFFFGATGKYLSLDGPAGEGARAGTVDAGIFWQVAPLFAIGAAGYNLIPVGHRQIAPTALGTGISIGSDRSFHIAADWRADFDRIDSKTTNSVAVGGEYLLANLAPLRAGYLYDETLGGKFWSVGAGLVTSSGVAIDLGYRQSIDTPSNRTLAVALKLFLFG